MQILQLIIKEHFLADIVQGKKKIETRDIRPGSAKKYIGNMDELTPKGYDAIQFYAGYNKDRKKALVEIKAAEILIVADEDGNDLVYEENGEEYLEAVVQYKLGKVLEHNY